ncbi:hypothetical protein ACROYT_G007699 [Oculina patagonica]
MEHFGVLLCFNLLVLTRFFTETPSANAFSFTAKDSYMANHIMKTVFSNDWLSCTLACQEDNICVSYNYNTLTGSCDLNEQGLQQPFSGPDELVKMQGMIFHQIRPASTILLPRAVQSSSQCDCSCTSESACRPGQGSYDRLPMSCKDIWENSRIRVDGSFYLRADSPSEHAHVFCHMTPIPGCGDGGWTLVMKIDGNKQTFTYDSEYWNNTVAYNEGAGTNLADTETKLSSFWSTPFTRLCLGMKYQNEKNWIALDYVGSSLRDVIGNGTFKETNLNVTEWKKLLKNSAIQDGCNFQGFNSQDKTSFSNRPKARIGILGAPSQCSATAQSRIGFGTTGSFYMMDDSNSCGNEHTSVSHKKAFGYIFVQ